MAETASRFQPMESVVESIRSRGHAAASVGPYVVGVADQAALESPARLAAYIRENAGTANVVLFTRGRDGSYNEVASHDEITSRAGRIESEQMRIRPIEGRHEASEQPAPQRRAQIRSLVFDFRLDDESLNTVSSAVNRNLDMVLDHNAPADVQRLLGFEGLLERYGFRKAGHISVRIDLDAVRAAGIEVDEAAVERDLRTNPAAVLSHFAGLGVSGAVQITQSEGTAWSERQAGAPLTVQEFTEFVGMVDAARRFAEQRLNAGEGSLAPGRLTGYAER